MYNLRKRVTMEDCGKWSHEVDQQITPKQEGVVFIVAALIAYFLEG